MSRADIHTLQTEIDRLKAALASAESDHERFMSISSYQQTLFDSMLNFAVIGTDLSGRVIEWNNGAEHVLGWTESQMLGQTTDRIYTPEDRDARRMEIEMEVAKHSGQSGDHRWHMRQDGSQFWASGEMTRVFDSEGRHTGYLKVLQDRTHTHLSAIALAESRRQYRELLDSIETGFCMIEMKFDDKDRPCDYRFVETNRAFESHTGLPKAIGRWIRDLVPDQDQFWFDTYGEVARTGESMRFEHRGEALNRWFEVHATAVDTKRGLVAVLFNDISARRNAEMALRQSEEYWRGIFERLDDGFILGELIRTPDGTVTDWRYLDVNPAWSELVGIPSTDVKGRTIRELFPAIENFWIEEIVEAVTHQRSAAFNHQVTELGRWYEGRIHPLEADRFTIIFQEVTDARRAAARRQAMLELSDALRDMYEPEQMAYAASAVLGRVLESDGACYLSVDAVGQPSLAGNCWTRCEGALFKQLWQGDVLDWLSIPLPLLVPLLVADTQNDPRVHNAQIPLSFGVKSLLGVPLVEDGQTVAALCVTNSRAHVWSPEELQFTVDVAERTRSAIARRRAENDLRQVNASLEQLVRERTQELMVSEEQLRQSQKMEAVGQLTGGIAHDFNNLLTGISGSLEMMRRRIVQGRIDELEKYVSAAHTSSQRASALTHRLLAFSRRQTLDPKPTDINTLVAGMEELIARTVGPAVETHVLADESLWVSHIDGNQLENALLNLCINARDAMPDGGKLVVETRNRALDGRAAVAFDLPPGHYVELSVTDTGAGMTAEVAAKAFEPFFTTKPLGSGTGLGLSMIYGFIRQSGGQAKIYSEVGKGSTISLYLPRNTGEQIETEPDQSQEIPRARAGETVLVVDDEPTVRMLVAEILEELGYRAIEAADGPAGLKFLESDVRIDLLVTDVGLPGGMNGRQMADYSRASRPDLKVLFITGYAESAVIGNGNLDANMHVITKPFSVEGLAIRIKTLIES
jgi:PAS domain S-box-containing protein